MRDSVIQLGFNGANHCSERNRCPKTWTRLQKKKKKKKKKKKRKKKKKKEIRQIKFATNGHEKQERSMVCNSQYVLFFLPTDRSGA